ncbi:hypothetical protein ATI61_106159 [Archangium gephyra]|uniref:Lipoprotein n=1 Tax=Archangium gephyra TaxID=48 RepID=A0AAC8TBU8_9BACT|nr:hypothetical protein [Archangium gephyra]AKI98770.1 Hypothetical protein AA314_00397 [Archangium gephyra]REG30690.1 hypothetical protein ATI61_106159 [Archangium gephyra]
MVPTTWRFALCLAVLTASGCAHQGMAAARSQEASLSRCSNPAGRYSIGYPSAWTTNTGNGVEPCRFFHPSPFEVQPNSEEPLVAVSVKREPMPLEAFVQGNTGSSNEVLQQERLTLAGRPAVRLELRATQDSPLLPPGTREYLYALGDGDSVVRVSTLAVRGLDYAGNQAVLEEMVRSLELR